MYTSMPPQGAVAGSPYAAEFRRRADALAAACEIEG
jgi:hypothetical protein